MILAQSLIFVHGTFIRNLIQRGGGGMTAQRDAFFSIQFNFSCEFFLVII